ncbi:MAG TPA: YihY/virulence factor BrkB family protein [Candidatus Acidoferrales bacterium]|nr:YihY/virulence factor BrkB family protein [Candidatus Acidoferrales bacterium]
MRAMIFPVELVVRVYRTLRRVYPRCGMISQAIAFNLFLAFFPFLLIAVGLAASPAGGRVGLMDLISDFTAVLPPGSRQFVQEYLVKRGPQAWKWALLGWSGTLLAGSQVMKLIMEGIHTIYGDSEPMGFLHKQFRGLLLLLVTIAPMLAAAILGILGRPLRGWLAQEYGHRAFLEASWTLLFPLAAVVLGIIALTIIYRVARPAEENLRGVLPGAIVATLLWWFADVLFGAYVRRMHYGMIFGGLAAIIGLMIWMEISAVLIFFGAAWNAEALAQRRPSSG